MSRVAHQAIEMMVNDLVKGFTFVGELAAAAGSASDGEAYRAWRDDFETSVINGFRRRLPGTDDEAVEILRRVMRGVALLPADRANLTYSLIDALMEDGSIRARG